MFSDHGYQINALGYCFSFLILRRQVFFLNIFFFFILTGIIRVPPNWNFFGPFEYWDLHRPMALLNTEFHDLFWIGLLGRALPDKGWWFVPAYIIRELPGILLVAGYFVVGPLVLRALFFKRLYQQMGFARYSVMVMLLLVMLLMPIKMVLRWTLNLHYIVGITEWFLNV